MFLSTWKHITGYICLCFVALVFLNYLIYVINKKLEFDSNNKITEQKIINVIKEVKEVEIFINDQKIETLEIFNDELSESWKTYKLLLDILVRENIA